MTLDLRAPTDDDWPAILRCACAAAPNAPDGNAAWLEARRSFDEASRVRRHYVGEGAEGVVAYGAIEEDADATRWRIFIVMSPENLAGPEGSSLFSQLMADLHTHHAQAAWAREHADDTAFAEFARARGFTETRRFLIDDPAAGAYQGVEVVEFERQLGN